MNNFKRLLPTILMIIVEIAIGIMLLTDGARLTYLVFICFGTLLLVLGIVSLIMALISGKKSGTIQSAPLVVSVLMIAFGGFLTAASGSVVEVVTSMTLIYGLILIIGGVFKIADYMAFRTFTGLANGLVVFSAILSIVLGFVVLFNPFGATVAIWIVMGVSLLVSAFLDIITLIIFGSAMKNLER